MIRREELNIIKWIVFWLKGKERIIVCFGLLFLVGCDRSLVIDIRYCIDFILYLVM